MKALTQQQVAALVDLTPRRLAQMAEKGEGPKRDFDGGYPAKEAGEWMRARFSGGNDKSRLLRAQADLAEMEAAEIRGELRRRPEMEKEFGDSVLRARARFLLIPSTVAPQVSPPGRTAEVQAVIEGAIYEALNELARMGDVAVDGPVESAVEAHR